VEFRQQCHFNNCIQDTGESCNNGTYQQIGRDQVIQDYEQWRAAANTLINLCQ